MPPQSENQIPLGQYIFERIHQVGVKTIFGVPGDFNLSLLDHIKKVTNLKWAGNANELNAAYETDGYSRVNGFGCLVTTFGVGELSAVNGVAGAYAEHVGLVHIVGMPSVSAAKQKLLLHHTLGDSRFDVFKNISQNISWKTTVIDNLESAPAVIDDLISTGYIMKRPVYLGLPSNFVDLLVPSSTLSKPLQLELSPNDSEAESEFVDSVLRLVETSERPIILVDACASRHNVISEVAKLARDTKFPVFTTPMGKSSFDEDSPQYYGIYVGALSAPDVQEMVEKSDMIISIGGLKSDFNTGSFSYSYHTLNVVELHSDYCKFKKATYENLQMKQTLDRLTSRLASHPRVKAYVAPPLPSSIDDYKTAEVCKPGKLTQDYLWKRASFFLRPGDVVVTETGTSSFGIASTHFPANTKAISQVLWGSIGFSLPAATGAAFSVQEELKDGGPDKRVVLFIGDGSLQLTVQALSDACRWGLAPYVFILNNNGYTIEKLIHGPHEDYNQIQPWAHQKMLDVFGNNAKHENIRISTAEELDDLFKNKEFNVPDRIRIIELMLGEFDAPANLIKQAKLSEKINEK